MSHWTHITACLSVDTSIEEKSIKDIVEKYLSKAPKITGSERDADVFVNIQSGFNTWTNADCEHCPYVKSKKWTGKHGEFECTTPDDFECPEGEYQTCVTISMQGDLRDRLKAQTQEEFEKFLAYINDEYDVRDYAVNIEGE